ncbi:MULTISPECIES: MFS transporter [Lactobacillaceae]|uniref:MFS transporter n=1 Tax=Limosilactobacillus alvi TaxID=990412 RepID=A0ABS2EL44_9LACO|nr:MULTISPECIES: MFS transporter [Lactobacillaceae]MBM6753229.1 MFS transporter [Limosilactobacillus alvi]QLL70861.1 MFS transporter [Lactobacillus sp. 3B(2020)]
MRPKTMKLKWLFVASLLNNTGSALLWPLITVYVHDYLHETMTVAGIVMFFISMSMMAGNYVGGWLFDHWKPYRAAMVTVLVATIATIILIFFHGWPIFAILLCIVSFADGSSLTIINAYGTAVTSKSTRYIFNALYMAMNVGVVIGTLLVGVLLPISPTLTFTVTAGAYVIFSLVTVVTFNVPVQKTKKQVQTISKQKKSSRQGIHLVYALCLCLMTVYLAYSLWETVMAVRITDMGIPFFAYSLLWTINGAIIVIFQPLVPNLAKVMSIRTQIELGILIFAASFLLLTFARTFTMFVITFVILTIGEMTGIPAVPAYIAQLTDPSETGKYQGMPNIAMSIGRAIGPFLGGLVIDWFNYEALFIFAFGIITVTLVYVAIYARQKFGIAKH